jgi:polyhydroxyalkanoate synthesis regulator phasin
MKSALLALALVIAFGFNSCTKDDIVTPDDNMSMMSSDYNSPANYIMDTYNAEEDFVPATTVSECEYREMEGVNGRDDMRKQKGLFLGDIFRKMKVTREQMKEIRVFLANFEKCKRETQSLTPEEVRALIKAANEKVRAIIEQVRSGKMTREEAKPLIEAINNELRETLESTVDQDARCKCLKELFAQIESKLTEEQILLWNEWKAKLENPCLQ